MTFPTDDAIRAMDGPALTRLAVTLGLAPAGSLRWEPHTDVQQARALFFDRLGEHGWCVRLEQWGAKGNCSAIWYGVPGRAYPLTLLTSYGHPTAETQALALLRCACLAERERQHEETNL